MNQTGEIKNVVNIWKEKEKKGRKEVGRWVVYVELVDTFIGNTQKTNQPTKK